MSWVRLGFIESGEIDFPSLVTINNIRVTKTVIVLNLPRESTAER